MTNYLAKEMSKEIERIDSDVRDERWWRRVGRLRVLNALFTEQRKKPVTSEIDEHRQQVGYGWLAPVTFSLVMVALVVGMLWCSWPKSHFYSYPDDYLRTIQNVEPCLPDGSCGYRRVMQEVVNGIPQPETEMNFCDKPRFEAGHILAWTRFVQRGQCTEIDGFDVVRENHKPKLADNCRPDYSVAPIAGHIVCDGGRAKF